MLFTSNPSFSSLMPDVSSTFVRPPLPTHLSVTQRSHSYALVLVLSAYSLTVQLAPSFILCPFLFSPFPALYLTKILPVCYYNFPSIFSFVRLIRPLDVLFSVIIIVRRMLADTQCRTVVGIVDVDSQRADTSSTHSGSIQVSICARVHNLCTSGGEVYSGQRLIYNSSLSLCGLP